MRLFLLPTFAALTAVSAMLWASDKITLQGERTIYTVECADGAWQGLHCTGHLVAADRFRFRALKAHREVVFWAVGASQPSGKFTDCDVRDGRHWTCRPNADASSTITLQMTEGVAVADATGRVRAFHAIEKWRWFFLKWGAPAGSDADA